MVSERLSKQMDFLTEVEKLKAVYRQNMVYDRSRHENSAEHSWHLALMAVVLSNEAIDPAVDIKTVIEMLLIHDIVEIDAETPSSTTRARTSTRKNGRIERRRASSAFSPKTSETVSSLCGENSTRAKRQTLFSRPPSTTCNQS
jgi:5'-deoxynucleotidase YfbR-like HD superfamily hydrolase